MNTGQENCFNKMIDGKNIMLTGSAGTGKSYIIKQYVKYCVQEGIKIAVTSTTGVSALLINGTTIHSWAGIGLGTKDTSDLVNKINRSQQLLKRWLEVKTIIIDEVSMMDYKLLEKLEKIARHVRCNNKIFGGIQIILCGDYCQLGPIKVDKFLFESKIYNKIIEEKIILEKIIRQNSEEFVDCLQEIRAGNCSDKTFNILSKCVNKKLINKYHILPTILYSKNVKVDIINNRELEKLKKHEKSKIYNSKFYHKKKEILPSVIYNEHFTKDRSLELTIGAQVMITYNIDIEDGIVNGTRGIIIAISNPPIVKLLDGREIAIPYVELELKENGFTFIKSQIPIKLAYALTIHKSQGSTIDYLELDIGDDIFTYGQTYTALSRASTLDGLSLLSFNRRKIFTHPKVKEFYNF